MKNDVKEPAFWQRIAEMNRMYGLPVQDSPSLPPDTSDRLRKFWNTLREEIDEISDIVDLSLSPSSEGGIRLIAATHGLDLSNRDQLSDALRLTCDQEAVRLAMIVSIADLLGDITVYCRSEAMKFGIPLEEVIEVIMDSNESKLGEDGKPVYNENGKFMKGPNYWRPEPIISELIELTGVESES